MTDAEHRQRHQELHRAIDELFADWVAHLSLEEVGLCTSRPLIDLLQWSYKQTLTPEPIPLWIDNKAKA